MLHRSLVACALLMVCGSPAMAQDHATAQAAPSTLKLVKERKVCREDIITGSHIPRTTCRTKAEWTKIDATNRAEVDRLQLQSQRHMNRVGSAGSGAGN